MRDREPSGTLREDIARVMETEPDVLPLLPELLCDLEELGGSADAVCAALSSVGVARDSSVLDLGCGKGAVAVALAERLGLRVDGVDGFAPFVEAARALARNRGMQGRCSFREADVRAVLEGKADYDVALLLGLGPLLGDHEATVGGLRRMVRPGGHVVIDDAFLAAGLGRLPGYEGYRSHAETVAALQAHGDQVVREVVWTAEQTRAVNRRNTELIRARGEALKARRPEVAERVERYVRSQERESAVLGSELVCAMWVLARS